VLRPMATGKAKLDVRDLYLVALLAVLELQEILLLIGLRLGRRRGRGARRDG
jgi:hypothetical protein